MDHGIYEVTVYIEDNGTGPIGIIHCFDGLPVRVDKTTLGYLCTHAI